MFNFIRKHKVASVLVFVDIVVILVAVLVIVVHDSRSATIDILVAPSEAIITLNDKKYENFGTYNVMPGDYHVEIFMEGMQSKEYDLSLVDGEYTRIWDYLVGTDGEFSYYEEHPDEVVYLADVADEKAKLFVAEFEKMRGIKDVLPLTFSNTYDQNATEVISISVDWGEGDECEEKPYCLIVYDYTGKNTAKALSMIREAGYNPDDYELVFRKQIE